MFEKKQKEELFFEIWFQKPSSSHGRTSCPDCLFVCLLFYLISTVLQFLNDDSSQIHVPWTIFIQSIILTLRWASRSAIPIILSSKGESYQF